MLIAESEGRGTCMIAGKVMMDRHAPPGLVDTADGSYVESKKLLEKWHKRGRQRYAVTPRFAITSTQPQLEAAGRLLKEFPDVYMQTHLSENLDEIRSVLELFPDAKNYTDVYDQVKEFFCGYISPTCYLKNGLEHFVAIRKIG